MFTAEYTPETAWIQTFSGGTFNPIQPKVEEVNIVDIAHALSYQCRYAGHTTRFYSVAEHSLYVSYNVPAQWALEALLHDASEAYLVDIPRPIKPFLANYYALEQGVMNAIGQAFNLSRDPACWQAVKEVDTRILADEKAQVMSPAYHPGEWQGMLPPLGINVHGYPPEEANRRFMARFNTLMNERPNA